MSDPLPEGMTTEELVDSLEKKIPGLRADMELARKRLYAEHPDPVERRRFLVSQCVRIEVERV